MARVSIVIPVYNKVELTLACLESLAACTPPDLYDVVVVDNASTDGTPQLTDALEGDVVIVRNEENLGFGRACNQGAGRSSGEFVLFLNNDTVLLPGWLEPLIEAMDEDPRLAAVQPRLLYPDGRLNDAGGLVFAAGDAWVYGKGHPVATAPQFMCRRAPDYASGACLLVRRIAFEAVGGFDDRYAPAYYEDTDLSFALRAAGWKVLYEPASSIVHVEGGTAGTDIGVGLKRYQGVNKAKFVAKWEHELARRPRLDPALVESWAHRGQGGFAPGEDPVDSWDEACSRAASARTILVVDPHLPWFDRNSGHVRLLGEVTALRADGHHVTFYATDATARARYGRALERLGVVAYGYGRDLPAVDPAVEARRRAVYAPSLAALAGQRVYDTVQLDFWTLAESVLPTVRQAFPDATVVVDSVDVHFVRERREADLVGSRELFRSARETKKRELELYRRADRVLVVTPADEAALRTEIGWLDVVQVPNVHQPVDPGPGFAARQGLFFVGNFGHAPNVDAVEWWLEAIAPALARRLPGVPLTVAGSGKEIHRFEGRGVEVLGWVPEILPHLHRARISVAPLRYGAGMKGKVGEALNAGTPMVMTSIAAEGMGLRHGIDTLIADDPEAFAGAVAALYTDALLWQELRAHGRRLITDQFGPATMRAAMRHAVLPARNQPAPGHRSRPAKDGLRRDAGQGLARGRVA
jgi:GT2 family glycosyltransferase/glycosyltransferase involved in cell wall biosynthesis